MKVEWEDNQKSETEDVFKKEKQEQYKETLEQEELQAQEQEDNSQNDEEAEETTKPKSISGLIKLIWDKIAVVKGYEPLNDNDIAYLDEHTRRFAEKYTNKISGVASPEVETILAIALTLIEKYANSTIVKKDGGISGEPKAQH